MSKNKESGDEGEIEDEIKGKVKIEKDFRLSLSKRKEVEEEGF